MVHLQSGVPEVIAGLSCYEVSERVGMVRRGYLEHGAVRVCVSFSRALPPVAALGFRFLNYRQAQDQCVWKQLANPAFFTYCLGKTSVCGGYNPCTLYRRYLRA
jgi:hypothetical protein